MGPYLASRNSAAKVRPPGEEISQNAEGQATRWRPTSGSHPAEDDQVRCGIRVRRSNASAAQPSDGHILATAGTDGKILLWGTRGLE